MTSLRTPEHGVRAGAQAMPPRGSVAARTKE
jgi:hypothetical protein